MWELLDNAATKNIPLLPAESIISTQCSRGMPTSIHHGLRIQNITTMAGFAVKFSATKLSNRAPVRAAPGPRFEEPGHLLPAKFFSTSVQARYRSKGSKPITTSCRVTTPESETPCQVRDWTRRRRKTGKPHPPPPGKANRTLCNPSGSIHLLSGSTSTQNTPGLSRSSPGICEEKSHATTSWEPSSCVDLVLLGWW